MPVEAALNCFASLPLSERLFVRARLHSAPLLAMAFHAVGPRVLEVGCGHGLLSALIATARPDWVVTGLDVDGRKVEWAARSVGQLANASFWAGDLDAWATANRGSVDSVVIADVLYLLPVSAWVAFLRSVHLALRPGGLLVLKEADANAGWRSAKALWQERLMVRLLGRTRTSGAVGFVSRDELVVQLEGARFRVSSVEAFTGYSTPHVLLVANST